MPLYKYDKISDYCDNQPRICPMSAMNQTAKRDVTVSKDALLKSYSKRLKDDVRSLSDNFSAIVKTCRLGLVFSREIKVTLQGGGGAASRQGYTGRGGCPRNAGIRI